MALHGTEKPCSVQLVYFDSILLLIMFDLTRVMSHNMEENQGPSAAQRNTVLRFLTK